MQIQSDPNPKMGFQYFCHFPGCRVPLSKKEKKWCQKHKKIVNHCSPTFAQEHELIKFGNVRHRKHTVRHSKQLFLTCIPLKEVWQNKKCPRCGHFLFGPCNVLDPHEEVISLDCLLCGFHSFLSRPRDYSSPERDQEERVG